MNGASGGTPVGGETGGTPQDGERWRERLGELIDRYAEDYLREGKSLFRTVRRTVAIVGTLVALAALGLVVVIAYAVLR
jgi:hypothetical protein